VSPELFGLHNNAEINTNQLVSERLLQNILNVQPRIVTDIIGKSIEDIYEEKALFIQSKIPIFFDLEILEMKYGSN